MEADLDELEAALGHRFLEPRLLLRALTHRSLANQLTQENRTEEAIAAGDNERLEFLGDAVLNLVVAEALFDEHPEWHEGELTRVRARLVSRQHMAGVAAAVELGRYLRLSKGEDRSGLRRKSTVLSNTMEAVMGALFLDGGLEPVRAFTRGRVMGEAAERLADELRSGEALGNYKSALQERMQAARVGTPIYFVRHETGPGHRKRFMVEVRLKSEANASGEPLARGLGSTKKLAEQDAARRALEHLALSADAEPSDATAPGNTGAEPERVDKETAAQ